MSVSEPGKIITPWAESGLKNTIPPAANPATGRAGFDQGFSAINMTAKEAGGIPPFGQDFNGIFYEVTNILRYMQAGGQPTFDAELAAAIGGYPKGAMVLGSDGVSVYTNTVDSNSSNPNSGGSGWVRGDLMLFESLRRSYAEAGYNLVGRFGTVVTVNTAADVVLLDSTGIAYAWTGNLQHTIGVGETPIGNPNWVSRADSLSSVNSVKDLRSVRAHGTVVTVRGYYPNSNLGGGDFRFDSSRAKSEHNGGTIISPTVTWDGTVAGLPVFLNASSETDPDGLGCWVRHHGYEVYVSWFGAVGDAVRPSSTVPDGDFSGTDDTLAVGKCRDYLQTIAFQPNMFVGFWGGHDLCFEPNKCYHLKGDNPLGSTRVRSVTSGDAGAYQRQSWRVNGHGCLLVWEVTTAEDSFIESYEAFTTQYYHDFNVIVAKAVGKMGTFYSNIANPGRNATQRHKFERVEVYHAMPSSTEHGLRYMFRYMGDNLGDRLITEQCCFHQAHTHFYSENGEAVQQGFKSTTFASYLNGSTFFHLRKHGSTFGFSAGCGFLMKGNNQTWLRTEYLAGGETGSNGGNTYMNVGGSRFEFEAGKTQTVANCDFGVLEIDGMTMSPGGLPSVTSSTVIARKTGVIRVKNSHVYGRAVVGLEPTSVVIKRAYAIKFINCQFSNDIAQNIFVEDAAGTLIPWRTAIVDAYQVPAVVIEGTDTRTATWQTLPANTNSYVFDHVYPCNAEYNTIPVAKNLVIGRYRLSSKYYYLDNRNYVVLPPFIAITSIKLSHGLLSTPISDTIRVKIGSAFIDYAIPNNTAKRNLELLPVGQVVVVSDWTTAERTIASEIRLAGVPLGSPNVIAFIEIEWRPAYGLNEIATEETGGVRLTRIA